MSTAQHGHKREDSGSTAGSGSRRTESQMSGRTQSTNPTSYSSSSRTSQPNIKDDESPTSPHPKVYFGEAVYASCESLAPSSTSKAHDSGHPISTVYQRARTDSSLLESEIIDDAEYDDAPSLTYSDEALPPLVPDVRPATSQDFAELFPTSRELKIRHDDTTMDGNMNLSVQTPVTTSCGYSRNIVLFHLRMYDLKTRDFSLRRYCRESGREIVHSTRKSSRRPSNSRPGFQRSLSNALAAFKSKSELKQKPASLKRHDSGYDSMHSDVEEECEVERPSSSHSNKAPAANASDVIALECSNYAHIDIRRKGFKADKRYDFDYWGCSYSWKKSTQKLGKDVKEVSYHLVRRNNHHVVARIFPEPLSEAEAKTEQEKGGWIPPCSMRITDQKILTKRLGDLADVFVATGLIALVDDSIRRHFHHGETKQLVIPLPKFAGRRPNKAYIGPEQLVDETFRRMAPDAVKV